MSEEKKDSGEIPVTQTADEAINADNQVVVMDPASPLVIRVSQVLEGQPKIYGIHRSSRVNELNQVAGAVAPALLLLSAYSKQDIINCSNLLKSLALQIKNKTIKAIVVTKHNDRRLSENFMKLGVAEFLLDTVSDYSFNYKINLHLKSLKALRDKAKQKDLELKGGKAGQTDAKDKKGNLKVKSSEAKEVPALELGEDIWLIKGNKPKKVGLQFVIDMEGPDPATGEWKNVTGADGKKKWKWEAKIKDPNADPKDGWEFNGLKPTFDEKTGEWKFVGQEPELAFVVDGKKAAAKVEVVDGEIKIAKDSAQAKNNIVKSKKEAESILVKKTMELKSKGDQTSNEEKTIKDKASKDKDKNSEEELDELLGNKKSEDEDTPQEIKKKLGKTDKKESEVNNKVTSDEELDDINDKQNSDSDEETAFNSKKSDEADEEEEFTEIKKKDKPSDPNQDPELSLKKSKEEDEENSEEAESGSGVDRSQMGLKKKEVKKNEVIEFENHLKKKKNKSKEEQEDSDLSLAEDEENEKASPSNKIEDSEEEAPKEIKRKLTPEKAKKELELKKKKEDLEKLKEESDEDNETLSATEKKNESETESDEKETEKNKNLELQSLEEDAEREINVKSIEKKAKSKKQDEDEPLEKEEKKKRPDSKTIEADEGDASNSQFNDSDEERRAMGYKPKMEGGDTEGDGSLADMLAKRRERRQKLKKENRDKASEDNELLNGKSGDSDSDENSAGGATSEGDTEIDSEGKKKSGKAGGKKDKNAINDEPATLKEKKKKKERDSVTPQTGIAFLVGLSNQLSKRRPIKDICDWSVNELQAMLRADAVRLLEVDSPSKKEGTVRAKCGEPPEVGQKCPLLTGTNANDLPFIETKIPQLEQFILQTVRDNKGAFRPEERSIATEVSQELSRLLPYASYTVQARVA